MPRPVYAALVLLIAYCIALSAEAESDDVQAQRLTRFAQPLRWDNIEGEPYWVAGARPEYRYAVGAHVVRLAPRETVTVRVPEGEFLRLVRGSGQWRKDEVEVMFGAGSGLYASVPLARSTDGRSLIGQAGFPAPALARVAAGSGALEFGLFLSRREALGELAPYRGRVVLPGTPVQLRRRTDAAGEAYWRLAPGTRLPAQVSGPARYVVEGRLDYPTEADAIGQTWKVEAELDGRTLRVLDFESTAEGTHPVFIDGRERLVSRHERGFLEVPAGQHRLVLSSTAPMFLRVLQQEDPDYLLPGLNAAPSPAAARPARGPALEDAPAGVEQRALQAARDNARRDGGLVGAALLDAHAARRPDYPLMAERAQAFAGAHTFFRDLLPEAKHTRAPAHYAWFTTARLLEVGAQGRDLVAGSQHREALLDRLAAGFFLALPAARTEQASVRAQRYLLPQRFAPTQLRIAAVSETGQRFWVQFDDATPRPLWIEPGPARPAEDYLPSPGEVGLALLQAGYPAGRADTSGGAFGYERTPAPLLEAGFIELPVPPAVREVRLWREHASRSALEVALQYRAALPFALTEQAYLQYLARLDGNRLTRFRELIASGRGAATDAYTGEVMSHWQALARLVRAEFRQFSAPVPPVTRPAGQGDPGAARRAQALERAGEWLPALEAWGEAYFGSRGEAAAELSFGQVRALEQLGEDYLAEGRLRQLLLYAETLETRRRAYRLLAAMHGRAADSEALLSLAAAAFYRDGETDTLADLAEALLSGDQPELALVAASLLPEHERRHEAILRAAYRLRWWRTLEEVAGRLDPDRRALWRGMRLIGAGDPNEAMRAFEAGGPTARAYLKHLLLGEAIRRDLARPSLRAAAVSRWAEWQASHPGPRVMRPAPELVEDYAGGETLYSIDRDLYGLHFRTAPDRPVRLRLHGPARLRIEARPLHAPGTEGPLEGWLEVRSGERLYATPILNNRPSAGLTLTGTTTDVPGRKASMELTLGSGEHEATVSAGALPVVVRVYAAQPELSLRVLPPLTSASAAALTGTVQAVEDGGSAGCWRACLVVVPRSDAPTSAEWRPMPRTFGTQVPISPSLTLPARAPPASPADQEATLLGRGAWVELLDSPVGEAPEAVRRRLTQLLWIAEHAPAHYERVLAAGLALAAAHRELPAVGGLLERLTRRSAWQPLLTMDSSAGLRAIPMQDPAPESPAMRVRRALLRPLAEGERLLSGGNRLLVTLDNLGPTELALDLAAETPMGQPQTPLTVTLEQDGARTGTFVLGAEQPHRTRTVSIPAGRRVLRVGVVRPYANQFLRVRVRTGGRVLRTTAEERLYHVATEAAPVQATLPGPAWLRIDERRDGETATRYRYISEDWETVVLRPEPARSEALLRLFVRRGTIAPPAPLAPAPVAPVAEPVPEPRFSVTARAEPRTVHLVDAFDLGGQEDGTWTVSAAYQDRPYRDEIENREEEPQLNIGDRERFREAAAAYRYFDEAHQSYYYAEALGREREQGGAVAGLRGAWSYRPRWADWNLDLNGSLYLQPEDTEDLAGVDIDGIAYSHFISASVHQVRAIRPKTEHRPQLSVFHRYTSEDEDLGIRDRRLRQAASRFIDQDVFTRYKALHPFGFTLGDTLYHRPWLDTWWYTGLQLTTNEMPFATPDALSATAGWRQRLGPATLEAGYTLTRFFADDERKDGFTRPRLHLDLALERWLPGLDRADLDFGFRHDFQNHESTFGLSLRWHFSDGRAYRDFDFGPLAFRDLREQRVPHARDNNRIETDAP
ncbi:MAG: hypothetical protein ACREWG_10980 [Gammaproteobacteria bacterium]